MPFRWSLNPYRGCRHACVYCYARATHAYFDLGVGDDFSSVILVKSNVAEVLALELSRRGWRREEVALGTATDAYQPAEGIYRLTRRCLEQLLRFRTPVSIITKGTLIARDIDLLVELTRGPGVTVCYSIPTVDDELWRRTEPGTAPPRQRLRVLERLRDAGVRAGVFMAPLLPGLSARPEQIETTARAAADHGAAFLGAGVLNLKPGVREHYLAFIDRTHPTLVAEYRRLYGGTYAPRGYVEAVRARVAAARDALGVPGRPLAQVPEPLQLPLSI